jgi:MFS family permease
MVVGLVASSLLEDTPIPEEDTPRPPFWQEFTELLKIDVLKENQDLFTLLLFIMVSRIGMQVSLPYLIVYLENYVGVTKTEFSIIGGAVMLGSAIFAIPFGILADRWNKRTMIAVVIIGSSIGGILLSLVSTLLLIAFTGLAWQAFATASEIASVAWLKDLLPEQNRGKFLGIRMIFWIAIPMVIGPWLGSTLIQNFGIPTTINGETGFIPVPIIFQVGSAIALLSLIPLGYIRRNKSA